MTLMYLYGSSSIFFFKVSSPRNFNLSEPKHSITSKFSNVSQPAGIGGSNSSLITGRRRSVESTLLGSSLLVLSIKVERYSLLKTSLCFRFLAKLNNNLFLLLFILAYCYKIINFERSLLSLK
ncbi:unnamed protein product [Chrysodeixis includens]|uniref:Uncharacterized protein n=1 Tax=Chrysodeixis includens TaxID=689277 RepID=A0A9N8L5M3_CHRIL|nr:unnamed protein product [Chrysodeixis includens]